jgi:hypothetical protein
MKDTTLRDDARRQVEQIGHADILVGIPSYNNASTIGHVVKMAAEGMVGHFPDLKPILVNSDGGSRDGTRQVVLDTPTPPGVTKLVTEYQGLPGKGSAFRTIFEIARALGVRACVVVDSDLRSITPGWIGLLAGPIIRDEYDYVAPFYSRHKHDGTITNNITYPMTRMLYGLDVRQPIGGDFGFSARLLDSYLSQDVWQTNVARYGIDIWMTTTAVAGGFRVCQARLGAKIHDAKDPAQSLGPMFVQVVGTLFSLMQQYETVWRKVTGSQPVPIFGPEVAGEPEPIPVTVPAMTARFRAGLAEHEALWAEVMRPETLSAVRAAAARSDDAFTLPAEDWVRVVFDFAVAFGRGTITSEQVVAMTPLYYGRTAGLVLEGWDLTTAEFEDKVVQAQAATFETLKAELLARWH